MSKSTADCEPEYVLYTRHGYIFTKPADVSGRISFSKGEKVADTTTGEFVPDFSGVCVLVCDPDFAYMLGEDAPRVLGKVYKNK